jgi:hypothetical protein
MKEIMNLALRSIFVHTSKGFLICRKILGRGADDFTSPPTKAEREHSKASLPSLSVDSESVVSHIRWLLFNIIICISVIDLFFPIFLITRRF